MEGSSQKSVLLIEGGHRLSGRVDVRGSKNASLAILSAVLACSGRVFLRGLPNVSDIRIKLRLMEEFGAKVETFEDGVSIDCSELHPADIDPEVARKIRTSFNMLGPLMARLGSVKLPQPGDAQSAPDRWTFISRAFRLSAGRSTLGTGSITRKAQNCKVARFTWTFRAQARPSTSWLRRCLRRARRLSRTPRSSRR